MDQYFLANDVNDAAKKRVILLSVVGNKTDMRFGCPKHAHGQDIPRTGIKTHDSESRGQEEAGRTRDEQVSYLHVAPL